MNNYKEYDRKTEKRIAAPSETLVLNITDEECYFIINSLDLYSRIWLGQYDRIDDFFIYDTGDRFDKDSRRHMLFQQIRMLLIPSLGACNYTSCSLGIWGNETDFKAINAYDLQQRLRYELSWYKNPEGDITVDYDSPLIKGELGDCSVFCERIDESAYVTLYLSHQQLLTIQTSLETSACFINRNIEEAFKYFTSDKEVLAVAKKLTVVYKGFAYQSFFSDKNYGRNRYRSLMNKTTRLMEKIKRTIYEKEYADFIRVNIPPANSFIPADEIMTLLNQPFVHFKKTKRKTPPQNVLKLPGAGFLTKMCRRERSTTDYLLVWYEEKSRTEYYYMGEEYIFKHDGRLDLPEKIMDYVRMKSRMNREKKHGE